MNRHWKLSLASLLVLSSSLSACYGDGYGDRPGRHRPPHHGDGRPDRPGDNWGGNGPGNGRPGDGRPDRPNNY